MKKQNVEPIETPPQAPIGRVINYDYPELNNQYPPAQSSKQAPTSSAQSSGATPSFSSSVKPNKPYITLCLCLIIGLRNLLSSCGQLYRLIFSLMQNLPTAGDELVLSFFSSIGTMAVGAVVACISMSKIWGAQRSVVPSKDIIYKIGHAVTIVGLIPIVVFCITIIIFICRL